MDATACVITKSVILISVQVNISPRYSLMVQNQITVSPCVTIAIWLSRSVCTV